MGILVRTKAVPLVPSQAVEIEVTTRETRQLETLEPGIPQYFAFEGVEATWIKITMEASEQTFQSATFDPALRLYRGDELSGSLVAFNDDFQGSLNSELAYQVPTSGTYTVRSSETQGRPGQFVLGYKLLVPGPQIDRPLTLGDLNVARSLGENSPIFFNERSQGIERYDLYRLDDSIDVIELIETGDKLQVRMSSNVIDSYLELGFDTPFGFSVVSFNDDAVGRDALIEIIPSSFPARFVSQGLVGDYWRLLRIRARSARREESGDYFISVARVAENETVEGASRPSAPQ